MNRLKSKNGKIILAVAILVLTGACGAVQIGFESTPELIDGTQHPGDEANQRTIPLAPPVVGPTKADAASGMAAIAWYGHVVSAAQNEDALGVLVLPYETGQIDLEASDPAVRAQIDELKDAQPPGRNAHFWGTAACEGGAPGACRLTVDYVRRDGPGPVFEPQAVEGWEGTIYSGPPAPGQAAKTTSPSAAHSTSNTACGPKTNIWRANSRI